MFLELGYPFHDVGHSEDAEDVVFTTCDRDVVDVVSGHYFCSLEKGLLLVYGHWTP